MKRALVFGPSGLLGPMWVNGFLDLKYSVLGIGLDASTDPNLTGFQSSFGNKLILENYDLTQELDSEIQNTISKFDPDYAVVNVGVDSKPGQGSVELLDYSMEDWKEVLTTNVIGVVNCINSVLRCTQISSIVVIGSLYASLSPRLDLYSHFNNGLGQIKNPAYTASKHALKGVVRQYATHFGNKGVRINLLSPGGVESNQDLDFKKKFISQVPMSRMLKVNELFNTLQFLTSDSSSYITGQEILVDGGYSLW